MQQFQIYLLHARGAATVKALSPICRRVRGTKSLLDDEARNHHHHHHHRHF